MDYDVDKQPYCNVDGSAPIGDNHTNTLESQSYAEIAHPPPAKPTPLGPKPKLAQDTATTAGVELQYSELDFAPAPTANTEHLSDNESIAYASADSLSRPRHISAHPSGGGGEYDIPDSTTTTNTATAPQLAALTSPAAAAAPAPAPAIYAQPIKNKKGKAKAVPHAPAPSNEAVLYAVPDKRK